MVFDKKGPKDIILTEGEGSRGLLGGDSEGLRTGMI